MFIIEGPDDLGKTTFANKVVKRVNESGLPYPAYYSHMTRPPVSFNFSTDYVDRMSVYGVQDRFHLGGIVYHERINPENLNWIKGQLAIRNSFVLLMYTTDFDWYEQRLKDSHRDQMYDCTAMMKFVHRWAELANPVHCCSTLKLSRDLEYAPDNIVNLLTDKWLERLKFGAALPTTRFS